MSVTEIARGIRFVGGYFGGMPAANRRFLRLHEREGPEAAREFLRARAVRALERAGADIEVIGAENVPEGGCVLLYNEASLVDLALLHGVIFRYANAGVGAEIFRKIPWMAQVAEKIRVVIFERGNRAAADAMLGTVTGWVGDGARLAMGGEGRISKDGSVGRFKRGGCLIAIRAGAPVVPVAQVGGPEMLPLGSLRMRPGQLKVIFGEPMSADGMSDDDAPDFAQRVHSQVVALREAARSSPPA